LAASHFEATGIEGKAGGNRPAGDGDSYSEADGLDGDGEWEVVCEVDSYLKSNGLEGEGKWESFFD